MAKEYRTLTGKLEVRSAEDTGTGDKVLSGYFVKYNSPAPATPYDFYEQVGAGCFGTSIEDNDIMALYNHNADFILGRQSAGTLILEDRSDGLFGTITINHNDTEAMNVYSRVQRGDIAGCSFGAWIEEEPANDVDGNTLFTITRAELIEVSVCPYPFYPDTTMEARNAELAKSLKQRKEFTSKLFEFKKHKAERKLNELKNHCPE